MSGTIGKAQKLGMYMLIYHKSLFLDDRAIEILSSHRIICLKYVFFK